MRALGLLGSVAIGCLITFGAGCGGDDDDKGDGGGGGGSATYSCNYTTQGLCWTWNAGNVPSSANVVSAWQNACTMGMGMTVAACPTSGAVGKCTFTTTSGGYSISQTVYYYPPLTAATGMQSCMTNNQGSVTATWTPL
jgi:hypothetical protein